MPGFTDHGMSFHLPRRKISDYGMNFSKHALGYMARDLQTKIKKRSSRWSKLEMRPWPKAQFLHQALEE